ncbi:MAG TPA: Flp pilus assembly protein CpaB [Terriglobales bacterium]|nr:Flp pilus assembly protein CpaB [Terriglobales bacterium]
MKKKLLPLLGIAFVVAVVTTGIFYGLLVGRLRSDSERHSEPAIVVAARSLDRGAVLDKSQVKLASWSSTELPPDPFIDPGQVVGLTVLQPISDGQPLTQAKLSSRGTNAARSIPPGMRAVSIRVSDSPGVISLLRARQRVDVQAVRNHNGPNGSEAELRTVLQDVEVLNVQSENERPGAPAVVTVLAKPVEADVLGVADAGARVRLVLRGGGDEQKEPLPSLGLAALFHSNTVAPGRQILRASANGRSPSPRPKPHASLQGPAAPGDTQLELRVRLASVSVSGLAELSNQLAAPSRADLLQVTAFRSGWDLEQALRSFESRRLLEVLSSSKLATGNHREVSMQAGAHWAASAVSGAGSADVRIQFLPSIGPDGKLRLRVQPEVTSSQGQDVASRRIETEVDLANGQSFLITGLAGAGKDGPSLVSGLFPGRVEATAGQELVVLATPRLAPASRGERRSAALLKKY